MAVNIDYERLAQENVKLNRTILENVTDLRTNPHVQDDTSATHMKNETTQKIPGASLIKQLLEIMQVSQ